MGYYNENENENENDNDNGNGNDNDNGGKHFLDGTTTKTLQN